MLETSVREVANCENTLTTKKKRKEVKPLTYSSVHRTKLDGLLQRLNGRFVGVDFVKQDGTMRRLNGRLGVRAYLKTDSSNTKRVPEFTPYITVFDVQLLEYRTVNIETACCLRADRCVYSIVG